MKIEDFRRMSLDMYPSLRRNALQEALIMNPYSGAAGAAGSGSGITNPIAEGIRLHGQNVSMMIKQPDKDNYQIVTVDYETGIINGPIDSLIPKNSNLYSNYCVEDGGQFYFGETESNNLWISLIDGAGNLVLTEVTEGNNGYDYWDVYSGDDNVIAWTYSQSNKEEGYVYKWYVNNVVNEFIFTNPNRDNELSWGWFNGWDETLDKSHSVYYYNPETGRDDVFILRADGTVIDVSDIVYDNGRQPSITLSQIGTNSILLGYYNGYVYDKIKILNTDGTHIDYDITQYSANNLYYYATGFGYIFTFAPGDQSKHLVYGFYDESLKSMEYVDAGVYSFWGQAGSINAPTLGNSFDYRNSPESTNNAYVVLAKNAAETDKLYRYSNIKIISKFKGHNVVTWNNPSASFGFYESDDSFAYPTFFAHTDGHSNLQLLVFTETGYTLTDTESVYTYVAKDFEIIGMGQYTMLQWRDTSHSVGQEHAFKINRGALEIASLWTSTNYDWDTNYDVAWITQIDEGRTYYFTPTAPTWSYFGSKIFSSTNSDSINPGRDFGYIGNHQFGTVLLRYNSGNSYAVLTRNTNGNLGVYNPHTGSPNIVDSYVANEHVIFKELIGNKYRYVFVDTTGTAVHYDLVNDTEDASIIASKRTFVIQESGTPGVKNIYCIRPSGVTMKQFNYTNDFISINDLRYRD
jgi:hypothetical protein